MNLDDPNLAMHGLTYAGLGAMLVALVGWFIFRMLRAAAKKSDSEASLDDRSVKLTGILEPILNEERAEKRRLQDALAAANERYGTLVNSQMDRQAVAIESVRHENREGIQRLHVRLDDCEKRHVAREAWLASFIEQSRMQGHSAVSVTNYPPPPAAPPVEPAPTQQAAP